jgi:hypothetical protein
MTTQEKIEAIVTAAAIDPEYFTVWERKFADEMGRAFWISPAQKKAIDDIYEKAKKR